VSFETCPYCHQPAIKCTGREVYPHRPELGKKLFWACFPCKAWVGCHPGGDLPLGRLANAELRQSKMAAHAAFDPIWQSKHVSRGEAYGWLARQLGITKEECHIGHFDVQHCKQVVSVCRRLNPDGNPAWSTEILPRAAYKKAKQAMEKR
jgi:hypothetical protein